MKKLTFTSESVSEGHPDKVCDQISDSILDEALRQDPESRVAAETMICPKGIFVSGEITSKANLDIEYLAKSVLKEIGYTAENGFDTDKCKVHNLLSKQSPDIAQGVNKNEGIHAEQGAGDQGIMFGYACKQTESYMPLPIHLSHQLVKNLAHLRKSKILPFLRPDSKSQVTVEYENNHIKRIDTIVLSTQHDPTISHKELKEAIIETLIKKTLPSHLIDSKTRYLINPTGKFVLGGPAADAGLTGRKIIVDTYGGWAKHGGGAFSGKDPSKVDRSAAYMARYVAKNILAADIIDNLTELEIQLSYAIGYPKPVGIFIQSPTITNNEAENLKKVIEENFDLSPEGIIISLNLKEAIYKQTATYGHFGRLDIQLPWEQTDKSKILKKKHEALTVTN